MEIDKDDLNDVTPKPLHRRPLRRMSSIHPYKNPGPGDQTTEDEYQHPSEKESTGTDTNVEEEEPAQPKKKKAKRQVREAIKAAGKEVREEGITKGKKRLDSDAAPPEPARGNCETGNGTSNYAIGLVSLSSFSMLTVLTLDQLTISCLIAVPSL